MEPITREEYYLAKIAGTYEGNTPEPVTIEEYYLATMAGDYSGNTPQPVTRLQYYMAKVAGVWGGSIPAPVTRLEYYWAAIASGEGKVFPPVTREEHFLVLVADAYSVVLTVVTGNPALLENSKGNRGLESLTLYGKSTQGSTTGANLLPCSEKEVVTTLKEYKFKNPLPAGGYRVSIKSANRVPAGTTFQCAMKYVDGNSVYRNMSHETKSVIMIATNAVVSFTIYSDTAYNESNGKTTIFTGLMINVGDATIPYEPYTGGKPSPSPEYPQEIENAGQDGEIVVEVLGKNLLEEERRTKNNIWSKAVALKAGITYILSSNKGFANLYFADTQTNKDLIKTYDAKSLPYTPDKDVVAVCMTYREPQLKDDEELQLEIGSAATAYEPYKPTQTLIIPTPNGLPGIPVSSDGNYTDADGQQWVCDEVDLANGEMVQRIGKTVVDGGKVKFVTSPNSIYWNLPRRTSPGIIDGIAHISRYFADGTFAGNSIYNFAWTTSKRMKSYFDTPEELNAFCVQKNSEGNPLTIYYRIETPIRTPLPPETIAAYKALKTYSPTTTVINDAGAGMSVGYAKMK